MTMTIGIYVLPTEENQPSQAIIMEGEPEPGDPLEGVLVTWSMDLGSWTIEGDPVPQEIGQAITEHAKDLGVGAFA